MVELLPSILSADFAHLADQVAAAEQGGGTVIHVDVMDGHFVPNITIGPPVVKSLRKVTKLPPAMAILLIIENSGFSVLTMIVHRAPNHMYEAANVTKATAPKVAVEVLMALAAA